MLPLSVPTNRCCHLAEIIKARTKEILGTILLDYPASEPPQTQGNQAFGPILVNSEILFHPFQPKAAKYQPAMIYAAELSDSPFVFPCNAELRHVSPLLPSP
jgi:hypothetical protein